MFDKMKDMLGLGDESGGYRFRCPETNEVFATTEDEPIKVESDGVGERVTLRCDYCEQGQHDVLVGKTPTPMVDPNS